MPDSFGQRLSLAAMDLLNEECKARGLTYEEVGERAKLDRSTVSRSLRKERNPSFWVFIDLVKAIGLDTNDVIERAASRLNQ